MVAMLSDDTEFKELKEKIMDVATNERNGLLIIILGVFLASSGIIFVAAGANVLAHFGGISVSLLGIFSTILGFYVTLHYAHQYNALLKELEHRL